MRAVLEATLRAWTSAIAEHLHCRDLWAIGFCYASRATDSEPAPSVHRDPRGAQRDVMAAIVTEEWRRRESDATASLSVPPTTAPPADRATDVSKAPLVPGPVVHSRSADNLGEVSRGGRAEYLSEMGVVTV